MKLILCSLFVAFALADRLENTYLPPNSARTAGGSGSFLSTPTFGGSPSSAFRSSGAGPANSYVPPAAGPISSFESPSGQYAAARSGYSSEPQFRILKLDSENSGDGSYRFEYETENQISQNEVGEVRNAGSDEASSIVRGTYSYTSPEGQQISVNYVADENGFRPEGEHIPTPPPIPADIQKSLARNAAAGSNGYSYQGSSGDSGAYDGVEIKAATSRQYLAPSSAGNGQGFIEARQYSAPASSGAGQGFTGATSRQYLAPASSRSGQGFGGAPSNQYLAPSNAAARQGITEATSRQYLAPAASRAGQGFGAATNRQYLAPAVARTGQDASAAPSNQYLAPASRQYLAPAVARAGQENGGYRY